MSVERHFAIGYFFGLILGAIAASLCTYLILSNCYCG